MRRAVAKHMPEERRVAPGRRHRRGNPAQHARTHLAHGGVVGALKAPATPCTRSRNAHPRWVSITGKGQPGTARRSHASAATLVTPEPANARTYRYPRNCDRCTPGSGSPHSRRHEYSTPARTHFSSASGAHSSGGPGSTAPSGQVRAHTPAARPASPTCCMFCLLTARLPGCSQSRPWTRQ